LLQLNKNPIEHPHIILLPAAMATSRQKELQQPATKKKRALQQPLLPADASSTSDPTGLPVQHLIPRE